MVSEKESHVAATAAIDVEVERGMNAVRELDPIVRNKFASDAATLAAWSSATHVERNPRRKPVAEATPAPESK